MGIFPGAWLSPEGSAGMPLGNLKPPSQQAIGALRAVSLNVNTKFWRIPRWAKMDHLPVFGCDPEPIVIVASPGASERTEDLRAEGLILFEMRDECGTFGCRDLLETTAGSGFEAKLIRNQIKRLGPCRYFAQGAQDRQHGIAGRQCCEATPPPADVASQQNAAIGLETHNGAPSGSNRLPHAFDHIGGSHFCAYDPGEGA